MEFVKRNVKLYMISGKARSGKDTVAKIIKDYHKDKNAIIISIGHYIKDYAVRVSNWDGNEDTKPRELLQQLGIELIRNNIDDKLFINRIIEDIEVFSYFYDVIIIDDIRLISEFEALKSTYNDIISIRVNRFNYENNLTDNQKNHLTETDLDSYKNFDYFITNNDNYTELKINVENILRGEENG